MSILRSAFNLADLTINVRALGIDKVKSDLAAVQNSLQSGMNSAQRRRYQLIQERNELQRTIYEYNRLNRTINMLAKGFVGGFLADKAIGQMTSAIKNTSALEDGFAKIQRTSGLSGKGFQEVADGVRAMAREMPLAITDLQAITEAAAQLGISGKDNLMKFTKTIAMLSDATGIAGDQLASDFAKMMNVFKINATDAEKYASVLSKLSVESTATADSILNMTRRIAGSAATMGMTAEQAMALAAATIDVGATAEVGGTAWTNFIGDMLENTAKWAEAIGMSEAKLESLFKDNPAEGIRAIVAALNSMNRDQRLGAMAKLGIDGARAKNTIQSLANAAELIEKHLKSAKDELASGGTLAKQFAITSDTLSKQWQLVKNEIMLATEALNRGFNEELKDGLKWMREMADLVAFLKFNKTREHLETLSDEELKNMFMNRKWQDGWWGQRGWVEAGIDPGLQAMAGDVLQKRKEKQDKAFREAQARPVPIERGIFDQAVTNITEWSGPWMTLAEKFAAKVRERLADEAERLAEVDAWSQKWLDENVADDQQAMLGAFGFENDPAIEEERLLAMRDNGVDEVAQRRRDFAMQIGQELAGQAPQFQSKFQGVDQLWRDLQTGSLTKKKTPEQLAEDQIKQMEKAIEIAKKVEKHLVDNGLIIPQVGP